MQLRGFNSSRDDDFPALRISCRCKLANCFRCAMLALVALVDALSYAVRKVLSR